MHGLGCSSHRERSLSARRQGAVSLLTALGLGPSGTVTKRNVREAVDVHRGGIQRLYIVKPLATGF